MNVEPITRDMALQRLSITNFKNAPDHDLKKVLEQCTCFAIGQLTLAMMITQRKTLWAQALGGVSTGKGAQTALDICEKMAQSMGMAFEFQTARKGLAYLAKKRGYTIIKKTDSPFVVCILRPQC